MLADVDARLAGQNPPPVAPETKANEPKKKKRFWLF
jgi:hypothetical protein